MKILLSYGTRPEWIKIAPVMREMDKRGMKYKTLFTGQHKDLIKEQYPDYQIEIIDDGNNRLDNIIKSIMVTFDWILEDISHVLVQGDTTSAFAVALSAFHHGIKVIHLEGGLRTYDKKNPYPEEINRRMISLVTDIHLCPTKNNFKNLVDEKIYGDDIFQVGNTVLDNLLPYKNRCEYTNKILITMHRRENHHWLDEWFKAIDKLAKEFNHYEFLLPIHPNPNVQKHKGLLKHVKIVNPLSHDDLINFLIKTKMVITDSGGLQEECSFFNKKCLICRKVTERPEAIGQSSFLVEEPSQLTEMFFKHINDYIINYECPFGDGHAAKKICNVLQKI
jgi:UDP-N-acetylglucosamine 2-epimerase (non-hydrolysing)